MSGELMEINDTAQAVSNTFEMVDVEGAAAFMDNYQEVCKALLDKSDYQNVTINGKPKPFKKKSAWRKIATAFNISDEILEKEIIRDENHQIISATFYVKATAPNGRSGVASASCAIFDKIKSKDTEQPSNFELRKRFNNAENDVITTAHTRAKSRAIADLVGMGEVSAEELGDMGVIEKPKSISATPKKAVKKSTKKTVPKKKGVKPKSPKHSDILKEMPVEQIKEQAITVEAEVVEDMSSDKPSKSIKDLMDEDANIKKAVDELREENRTVNRDSVKDRLLTLMQAGAVTEEEYKKAREILE